jgi:hypothetical protein
VPYYRQLLGRHGLAPGDIRSAADLAAVPITTKRDLQAAPASLLTQGLDPRRLVVHRTTGSTGEPTIVRRAGRPLLGFRPAMRDVGSDRIEIALARLGLAQVLLELTMAHVTEPSALGRPWPT